MNEVKMGTYTNEINGLKVKLGLAEYRAVPPKILKILEYESYKKVEASLTMPPPKPGDPEPEAPTVNVSDENGGDLKFIIWREVLAPEYNLLLNPPTHKWEDQTGICGNLLLLNNNRHRDFELCYPQFALLNPGWYSYNKQFPINADKEYSRPPNINDTSTYNHGYNEDWAYYWNSKNNTLYEGGGSYSNARMSLMQIIYDNYVAADAAGLPLKKYLNIPSPAEQ